MPRICQAPLVPFTARRIAVVVAALILPVVLIATVVLYLPNGLNNCITTSGSVPANHNATTSSSVPANHNTTTSSSVPAHYNTTTSNHSKSLLVSHSPVLDQNSSLEGLTPRAFPIFTEPFPCVEPEKEWNTATSELF